MYSYKERMKAVRFYINSNFRLRYTIRTLGYPSSRVTLSKWYKEYCEKHKLSKKYKRKKPKFSKKMINKAIKHYYENGRNKAFTVKQLGYPCKYTLHIWLQKYSKEYTYRKVNSSKKFEAEQKAAIVKDIVCNSKKAVTKFAKEYNVSRTSLYNWSKSLLGTANMRKKKTSDKNTTNLSEAELKNQELMQQIEQLKKENYYLAMRNDVLEEINKLLKKEKGINHNHLTNQEKTQLIDALKDKYSVKELLLVFNMAKSSYYYQKATILKEDKYSEVKVKITKIFKDNYESFGYRRIKAKLKELGILLSEKVIIRLMKEIKLSAVVCRRRKYSSYMGEISPAAENIVNRNFHSKEANRRLLTDLTEFSLTDGKVYLSPLVDCFDGCILSWSIGVSPSSQLVISMLDKAISSHKLSAGTIIHSDRGCQYRGHEWINKMKNNGFIRSMSKKGCSPDNSACEGFFGRLKNEFFYNRNWSNISCKDFIEKLDKYITWYNNDRIKKSLGYKSPIQYRKDLGIIS